MNLDFVKLEKDDRIATIIIDSPKTLNALSNQVMKELEYVADQLKNDKAVDIVIITGAGEKAFVAGANVKELSTMSNSEAVEASKLGNDVFSKIAGLPQPVIAAVNGYALGGGFELALACDFRFASENAVFGLPEVGLGIMPGYGGTQRLQRLVNPSYAKELIFTSRNIKAEEALEKGIVTEVTSQEELIKSVKECAEKILKQGQLGVRRAKEVVDQGIELPLDEALELEAKEFGVLFDTKDQTEGMAAFLEKRKPEFKSE